MERVVALAFDDRRRNEKRHLMGGVMSGAGGSRTLVQTSNYKAFYMLSFRLVFDACLTGNGLTYTYLLKVLVLLSKR